MKNTHPFAINILKLQEYDFTKTSIDEVVFFEWLVIKRKSFKEETFYYQQRRVTEEIGIKRSRLETIRNNFEEMGLILDHASIYNTLYYTVNLEFVKNFIATGVKKEFQKPKIKEIEKVNFDGEKQLSAKELEKVNLLKFLMNTCYNERRQIHNKMNVDLLYLETSLPMNDKSYRQLNQLQRSYDDNAIINSFESYCDDAINYKGKIFKSHMVNHFSSYDHAGKKFSVFERHLQTYNDYYTRKK
jgi:hypothetical protein